MRRSSLLLLLATLGFVAGANAVPVTYTLEHVKFDDGGTASGSFTFDPDAGTPCSTHATPCGTYSNVSITTTTGSVRTGATYKFVCGQDVPTCVPATPTGPDSTAVLYLTTTATDQTNLPGLALFFTGVGGVPPDGLGASPTPIDISNSSSAVGAVQEASCLDAACSQPTNPSRVSVAGQLDAVTFLTRYAANLGLGESVIDLTNAGTNGGVDATDFICANVYVFAQDQQLISCCACPLSPNDLQTLSVQKDLISNTLTAGVPTGVTIALVTTDDTGGGACDAASVDPTKFVSGLRAWGTTIHKAPLGALALTETEFSQVVLSGPGVGSEFNKMTSLCGFIESNGSGFGTCNSCTSGAAGAAKKQ